MLKVLKAENQYVYFSFMFQGLGINVVNKIYIQFPHRWWSEECDGFSFLHNEPGKPTPINEEVRNTCGRLPSPVLTFTNATVLSEKNVQCRMHRYGLRTLI